MNDEKRTGIGWFSTKGMLRRRRHRNSTPKSDPLAVAAPIQTSTVVTNGTHTGSIETGVEIGIGRTDHIRSITMAQVMLEENAAEEEVPTVVTREDMEAEMNITTKKGGEIDGAQMTGTTDIMHIKEDDNTLRASYFDLRASYFDLRASCQSLCDRLRYCCKSCLQTMEMETVPLR